MLPRSRAGLITAALAVAAVLITAVALLASGPKPAPPPPEIKPAPVAQPVAPPPRPPMGVIRWHEQPKPAPSQTVFRDASGADLTLAAFTGKVLVVNFWATWCAPCVEEMPTLNALQQAMGGEALQVLAISQDREGAAVARPFLDKNGWTDLALYVEPGTRFAKDAQLRGLPTTIIVDKTGLEVGRLEGTIDWMGADVREALQRLVDAP
jgi:thiol-disulfide isomerase/thioredoxin